MKSINPFVKPYLAALLAVLLLLLVYIGIYTQYNRYDGSSSKRKELNLAVPADPFFLSQGQYARQMDCLVLPYVRAYQTPGFFSHQGRRIAYHQYLLPAPKGNIVISHGFTERKEKYQEMIYYCLKKGYQVFILDHFSHGSSSRASSDSSLVHCSDYHVWVNDLQTFITIVVQPKTKGQKTILYGHSMGGGIAARTLEEYPQLVDGLILNTPLFKLRVEGIPDFVGEPIAKTMVALGKGSDYALGARPFDPKKDKVYHPLIPATYCLEKGSYWHHYTLGLTQHPSFGASWATASALMNLTHSVVKPANVEKITVPMLLFQAERDNYVDPKGHFTFANRARNLKFYWVKGAGHEIYLESNVYTIPYFQEVFRFMESI